VPCQALDQLLVCKQNLDQGQVWRGHDMNSSVTTQQARWSVTCVMLELNSHVPQTNYSISKNHDFVSWALYRSVKVKRYIYPCNKLWRPVGLSDVEASTFCTKSDHRW
jgi:hypothetical protein